MNVGRWSAIVLGIAAAVAARGDERPVMIDSNGPGSAVFVLDASGSLHALRLTRTGLEEYGRFALPRGFTAADMAYAADGGREGLLFAGTRAGSGTVVWYSLDGKLLGSWGFRGVCSGIDFSAGAHAAYVATSDSNEIYRVDLRGTQPTLVARIADAAKLGPVALDDARGEIYAADVALGRIYRYAIAARSSAVIAEGLSAPTALAFDAESRLLFVADPGRRAILTVETRASDPAAVQLVGAPLNAPYGVTLVSQGRVAVADHGAGSVLVFSRKGDLLFQLAPRRN